ncbi:sensor histidine kinase [Nonomuraea aridisoli]|uniref:histidine kinase n=1 Tax=Nonomuraea aridisoli TaxID=2070368 RepID=A0A2W2D3H7_9ACTN|nr:HAMP domain-containing sensor histidine kinase [Nonomuraea aridisoli]PZG06426.1 two-component sensor histidine kinase [Nonomuraea aridisoli]
MVILTLLGVTLDLTIRYKVQADSFDQAERVASQWSAAARNGIVPHRMPAYPPVDLVQIVDARMRVVDSSRAASDVRPLSTLRPPPDDRFQRRIECEEGRRCVMLMAIRLTPEADAGVVFAGLPEPSILSTHSLEYFIAGGILVLVSVAAWITWALVGRTLRPVDAIRARISEITVSDLSLRVPVPPGRDELAQLSITANQTLARLESAVRQQREFASTTSHELRSPLAGLRTQLEEALTYPDEVDPRETIRTALTATDRLEAIVNDLLVLARLRATDAPPEPIDLGDLVCAEVKLQPHRLPMNVRATAGLMIRGSRMQLIRVLDNLLVNAQRHAESAVEITVDRDGDQAVVAVTDDGPGVDPANRERIFERFVRLDDSRRRDPGGSGLGLAISRDIARAHHGTLRVEDSAKGARFVLRLPLADRPGGPADPRPAPGALTPARKADGGTIGNIGD